MGDTHDKGMDRIIAGTVAAMRNKALDLIADMGADAAPEEIRVALTRALVVVKHSIMCDTSAAGIHFMNLRPPNDGDTLEVAFDCCDQRICLTGEELSKTLEAIRHGRDLVLKPPGEPVKQRRDIYAAAYRERHRMRHPNCCAMPIHSLQRKDSVTFHCMSCDDRETITGPAALTWAAGHRPPLDEFATARSAKDAPPSAIKRDPDAAISPSQIGDLNLRADGIAEQSEISFNQLQVAWTPLTEYCETLNLLPENVLGLLADHLRVCEARNLEPISQGGLELFAVRCEQTMKQAREFAARQNRLLVEQERVGAELRKERDQSLEVQESQRRALSRLRGHLQTEAKLGEELDELRALNTKLAERYEVVVDKYNDAAQEIALLKYQADCQHPESKPDGRHDNGAPLDKCLLCGRRFHIARELVGGGIARVELPAPERRPQVVVQSVVDPEDRD